MGKRKNAHDLVSQIQSGDRVFVHGGSATPSLLLDGLVAETNRLTDVHLIHLHTLQTAPEPLYTQPQYAKSFRITNLFVGENIRTQVDLDRIDYLPCFLSEIPNLFRSKRRPIDVALLHLSPPDRHGYCTLGTSTDVARAAFEAAGKVFAQVNVQMPRVHGDTYIHIDEIDSYIEVDVPLPEPKPVQLNPDHLTIGKFVSEIVEDGACLQVGIGAAPDAILEALKNHRHLGLHTEMWSDGVLKLIQAGVIDNSQKRLHPGKNVSGFIIGSRTVYDFIHDNPSVIQFGVDFVNNPYFIAKNPKVTAINSAVEIDLTGQVCADSVGHRIISGVGGQMDFIRGASLSEQGKPIIAMTSRTSKGKARIVPFLKPGAGVVTTRAHVHFVVTEYGRVDLCGKTVGERARSLIEIAHPDDREWLSREWHQVRSSLC